MEERIALFENFQRETSMQNNNLSVTPGRASLRRTNTAFTSSGSREPRTRPISRNNAASFRGRDDFLNIVANHASSRRNSEEQRRRSEVIAEESGENEVQLWQFKERVEKEKITDIVLGLEDIKLDEGNEHYVIETIKQGPNGPESNKVYYQVTRKTALFAPEFRDVSGRQHTRQELTLSNVTDRTDSGIELGRSPPHYSNVMDQNHNYESVYLEVPDIKAGVKRKSSEDQKLFHIVQELIDTEKNYLSILDRIVNEYKPYLEAHSPVALQGKSKYIFGNIPDIHKVAKEFLSCLLSKGIHDIEGIADVFIDFSSMFELYPIYCANKPTAEYYLSQFKGISVKKQLELKDDLDLSSHMITPIQRIGRYILMLEDIQKELAKQNSFSENIKKAVQVLKKEMQKGNDSIAIESIIVPCQSIDLTKYGSYIIRDQFKVKPKNEDKYEATVFLFEKILVFTERSERSKNTEFEEFKYKDNIKIDNIFVRTRQEPTIIELLAKDNSQIYTLHAETKIVRDSWMESIGKVLEEQLVEAKAQHNIEIRTNLNVSAPKVSRQSSQYYSSVSGEYDEFYDAIEDPKDHKSFQSDDPKKAQASAILEGLKKRSTTCAIDSIKHCPVDLSNEGQFEMCDDFLVLKPSKYDGRVFLFEKIVVFTNVDWNNSGQYFYQASINMRDLGVSSLETDSPIFHLYDSAILRKALGGQGLFELKAKSADVKLIWTKKIEKLLTQERLNSRHKKIAPDHGCDDDMFVSQGDVKVFKMEADESEETISRATKNFIFAEESYIAGLRIAVEDYEQYFEAHGLISGMIGKSSYLFGNVSSILGKAEEFLNLLRNQNKKDVEGISSVFIDMASMFELYPEYAKNKPKSDRYLKEIHSILKERQDELGDKIPLATYLSRPIQRLPQYLIWLEHIKNNSQLQSSNLERAISIVKKESKQMDDCFAIDCITDCLIERDKYGSFIMSGQFFMQKPFKYEATVYLFENVVIFTKNDPNNINTYMDSIEMSALHMTPFPNDPLMFHLVNFPRLQSSSVDRYTFILKSKSSREKEVWTDKIKNMLWEQLQRAKEQQDIVSAQPTQRRTEASIRTPPRVPPKNRLRYTHYNQ